MVAFYKDATNLKKIRPIGIGTALRRIAGSVIMTIYQKPIIEYLLPLGQFGITMPGGVQFIIHSVQAQIDKYINKPSTPTRALLLLDLKNFFNETSREACEHTLTQQVHPSTEYYTILHYSI